MALAAECSIMVLAAERRLIDEALVVKGLFVFAAVAAGLALVASADDDPTGALSGVRQLVHDIFSAAGLIPTALALALAATVLITKAPRRGGGKAGQATVPRPATEEESRPKPEPESVAATEYDQAVEAMAADVASWSPPGDLDPSSDFAEILTREPPRSPWA